MRAFRREDNGFRWPRWLGSLCLGCALFPVIGCKDDEIRKYTVPRSDVQQVDDDPQGKVRMLVAVFQPAGSTWFFKLVGATESVEQVREAFEAFIQSVRFTGQEKPISWTVPAGWKQQPEVPNRYAVFRVNEKEPDLELTIDRMESSAGGLLANVKRWRGQISLKPIGMSDLPKYTKESKVDGIPLTLVTLTGNTMPSKGAGMMGMLPPTSTKAERRVPNSSPVKYTKPNDWKELPAADGVTLAAFQVGDNARVTITQLSGNGGGLAFNVDRWRTQVKLPPAGDAERGKSMKEIQVAGRSAIAVDLVGPESAGAKPQRIVAVMAPGDGNTWFIKMTGPTDQVAAHKSTFEAFLGTITFGAGQGAKP